MGLTDKQVQKRWDANVAAIQQAQADLVAAMMEHGRVGEEAGKVIAPLRRKAWMGQLSAAEADVIEEQEARVHAARDVVDAAREAYEQAQIAFKAGVE